MQKISHATWKNARREFSSKNKPNGKSSELSRGVLRPCYHINSSNAHANMMNEISFSEKNDNCHTMMAAHL